MPINVLPKRLMSHTEKIHKPSLNQFNSFPCRVSKEVSIEAVTLGVILGLTRYLFVIGKMETMRDCDIEVYDYVKKMLTLQYIHEFHVKILYLLQISVNYE